MGKYARHAILLANTGSPGKPTPEAVVPICRNFSAIHTSVPSIDLPGMRFYAHSSFPNAHPILPRSTEGYGQGPALLSFHP